MGPATPLDGAVVAWICLMPHHGFEKQVRTLFCWDASKPNGV